MLAHRVYKTTTPLQFHHVPEQTKKTERGFVHRPPPSFHKRQVGRRSNTTTAAAQGMHDVFHLVSHGHYCFQKNTHRITR